MKPVPSPTSEELDSQDALNALEDDATDILEAANQVQLNDRREAPPKVDADFFNRFDDDADESDMRPAQA
ncbi:small acidic 1 [Chlorella sorokiniana]|jgi:hypothetical protein|uniref:Small acidic 1 n=1 Tax=Chlorella sorokiniana TaxID=3076 RepID=A0A2P6TPC2_CHLSO|nr:small acidic 1 [Chlorella sorokiniana]|eukprot:PRW51173.1 small acidic 1 [Chlorella sorokiniana]